MPSPKFEIHSLPQLVERNGRFWFKVWNDRKGEYQPDMWREPLDNASIQALLNDTSLSTHEERVKRLTELSGRDDFHCSHALETKQWPSHWNEYVSISTADFHRQVNEPVGCASGFWFYRNRLVKVVGHAVADELPLLVKHKVLSHEKALQRVRREVEAFENFEKIDRTSREPIPERVRLFVWQRDQGRCAKCDSQHRLEYDHIIPLAKGGSNTERNIQLLCESCNRVKGSSV